MNRPNRFVRLFIAMSILAGMLAMSAPVALAAPSPGGPEALWDGDTIPPLFGAIDSATANNAFLCLVSDDNGELVVPGGPFCDGAQEVYFPAVGNGDDFGLGAAQTSVTIQNIDIWDAYIFFYVGNGNGWSVTEYAYLAAGASKTFSADDLGVPEGAVVPVAAVAYHILVSVGAYCEYDDVGDYYDCGVYGDYPGDVWGDVEVLGVPALIAGVTKQAVEGNLLPMTTTADTAVSGYNGVSGREIGFFDQLYFPIVQTNCGPGGCWNSVLRIANVGLDANAAVTVRFFPADDGSGSLQTGFQLQALVDVGETWSITLSDWVPDGWVGSAHVFSDDAVAATVDRFKAGTDMWITNVASNATSESDWQFPTGPSVMPYVLFAPDVRMDYNGWNTGINVANTVDADNNVNVQFFGNNGNAPQTLSQRLAEHGMTYFYEPSDPSEDDCSQPAGQAPTCDFVGGAIILSEYPVAAVVDGVKYYGNDSNVGHAFSYSATGNIYTDLALALAQKGNPASGMGATSGINFLNPNALATFVQTWWVNPSGFQADNYGPVVVWVPGYATGFVYTMFQHNLPNGFTGAALVTSELPIAATSANVDYQVAGDGTVIYNLSNPCGFFRQAGECVYEAPVDPPVVLEPGLIVKTVSCPDCEGAAQTVVGATVNVTGVTDDGDDYFRSSNTNATGTAIFSVPAGVYDVEITDVPSGYAIDPATAVDEGVVVAEGETVNLDNTVLEAGSTKIIDTAIPGLLVCVYEVEYDQGGKPEPIGEVECYRPYVELPKDFTPGQGEVYERLRGPQWPEEYLEESSSLVCGDFEYLDDAQDFLTYYISWSNYPPQEDPYYPSGIDPNRDGVVNCSTLYPIPYIQPATDEEAAEILGALYVTETDENGDASFDLPAGCYYAVIGGLGYETVIEEFCLEPGETEHNEVNLGIAPGYLDKTFYAPFYDEGEGPDWTDLSSVVVIFEGDVVDEAEDDDEEFLGFPVFVGGPEDLSIFFGSDYAELFLTLAPGEYTLCWEAWWEFEIEDGVDYIGVDWNCETFTIVTEETTVLENYSDDNLLGTLDVLIMDDENESVTDDILVLLFDQSGELIDWACTDSFSSGWVSFYDVPNGNYTVTATDSASEYGIFNDCGDGDDWETQDASKVYDIYGDWWEDGYVWDYDDGNFSGDPDVIIALTEV